MSPRLHAPQRLLAPRRPACWRYGTREAIEMLLAACPARRPPTSSRPRAPACAGSGIRPGRPSSRPPPHTHTEPDPPAPPRGRRPWRACSGRGTRDAVETPCGGLSCTGSFHEKIATVAGVLGPRDSKKKLWKRLAAACPAPGHFKGKSPPWRACWGRGTREKGCGNATARLRLVLHWDALAPPRGWRESSCCGCRSARCPAWCGVCVCVCVLCVCVIERE